MHTAVYWATFSLDTLSVKWPWYLMNPISLFCIASFICSIVILNLNWILVSNCSAFCSDWPCNVLNFSLGSSLRKCVCSSFLRFDFAQNAIYITYHCICLSQDITVTGTVDKIWWYPVMRLSAHEWVNR